MEIGDSVAIYKTSEGYTQKGVVGVGAIVEVTTRLYRVKSNIRSLSGAYLRSSLRMKDDEGFSIVSVSPERAKQIVVEIEQREIAELQQRCDEDDRRKQAEYEALPEEIKLARKLKWLGECNREEKLAKIPIDLLREIITWAEANQKAHNLELD
jgi:hypothetical protein